MKTFIWWNIVKRFGIPYTHILDNSLQFDNQAFQRYCCELGIRNRYSTLTYPQSNGQTKATNKVIVDGLKKRLDKVKGKWVDELPHVLWAYRTTSRRSTWETVFSMAYGSKMVIPLEIGLLTMRTDQFDNNRNEQLLSANLDLIEERREIVTVKLAHYQQRLKQRYDKGLKIRAFVPRNLVLRKVVGNMKNLA